MYKVDLTERELDILEEGITHVITIVSDKKLLSTYKKLLNKLQSSKASISSSKSSTNQSVDNDLGEQLKKEFKAKYNTDLYYSICSVYEKAPPDKKGEEFYKYYLNRWKSRRPLLSKRKKELKSAINNALNRRFSYVRTEAESKRR